MGVRLLGIAALSALWLLRSVPVQAQDRLCDPAFEDCRAALIELIRAEASSIDVAFWFMEDGRYANELIAKARQGVPVRVLVDPRANAEHPVNAEILQQLAAAGIPMRRRVASGILHWKMMLFGGQRTVQFSGANYSPHAFRPEMPFVNYTDEAIYFTTDAAIVESFMRRFDDLWVNTTTYADHANMTGQRTRRFPLHPIHPNLNFAPDESFRNRSVQHYNLESEAIDVTMYRITDAAHTDAIMAAVARGVPVRLITAPEQYRDPTRLWHSWNVDRLYVAGVQIRHSAHVGLNHQKSVQLRGQGVTIFGSSNWTSPSSNSQEEHNYFTTKPFVMQWFTDQFERKWNNLVAFETQPFQPLPPDPPIYSAPANLSTAVSLHPALVFDGGPFAHLYDIYFGTTPDPPLLEANVPLGPRQPGRALLRYPLPPLTPFTTYYWRVVGRTMALQEASGEGIWTFTTGSTGEPLATVQTLAATDTMPIGATLRAQVAPNATVATVRFDYGLTPDYGRRIDATPVSVRGTGTISVSATVAGLSCSTVYHYRVVAINGGGTSVGSDMAFTTAPCTDDRVVLGLGRFGTHGGWIAAREGNDAMVAPGSWFRVPWTTYNEDGGSVRVAAGDLDGDGLDEVVAGLGTGSAGWIAIFDDAAHGYAFLRWIQLPWPEYNRANGEILPAVGDIDGDGRAEIVAGLGPGGEGWFSIFEDAGGGYAHVAWRQVPWPLYTASGDGATHPAIGNVDGLGASEIIVGLGAGGAGWLAVSGDASTNYAHREWLQVNWATYNRANGATFPAAGDLDADGRAEIVTGFGSGGAGWLAVVDDGQAAYAHRAWIRASWPEYNRSSRGETHPAVGNMDGDPAAEIVIGLDRFGTKGGWFETFDDAANEHSSLGWRQIDWVPFNASGGGLYPAVGRFR